MMYGLPPWSEQDYEVVRDAIMEQDEREDVEDNGLYKFEQEENDLFKRLIEKSGGDFSKVVGILDNLKK